MYEKNSILVKLEVVISFLLCFSQQHLLVDLDYDFLCGSFGIENFHTCTKHKDVFSPKIPWVKKNSSILGRVSKFADAKLFSYPMLVNLAFFFCINLLDLKLGTHVVDMGMIFSPKFCN